MGTLTFSMLLFNPIICFISPSNLLLFSKYNAGQFKTAESACIIFQPEQTPTYLCHIKQFAFFPPRQVLQINLKPQSNESIPARQPHNARTQVVFRLITLSLVTFSIQYNFEVFNVESKYKMSVLFLHHVSNKSCLYTWTLCAVHRTKGRNRMAAGWYVWHWPNHSLKNLNWYYAGGNFSFLSSSFPYQFQL